MMAPKAMIAKMMAPKAMIAKMTALKETTTRIIQPVNPKIRTTVRVEVTRRKRQQRIELPRQVT